MVARGEFSLVCEDYFIFICVKSKVVTSIESGYLAMAVHEKIK